MVSTISRFFNFSSSIKAQNFPVILSKCLIPSSLNFAAGKKTLAEELGFPEPPKRPTPPIFRYCAENIGRYKNIPRSYPGDKIQILSKEFKELSEEKKKTYENNHQREIEQYNKRKIEYNKSITTEQIDQLKKLRAQRRQESEVRTMRKKTQTELEVLNKPKIPASATAYFIKEQFSKMDGAEKSGNVTVSGQFKRVMDMWRKLPATSATKEKFLKLSRDAHVKYQEELERWENKMLKVGREDLVRKLTLNKNRAEQLRVDRKEKIAKEKALGYKQ